MQSTKYLTVPQWKMLNQFREYLLKLSSDKSLQNSVRKDFAQFLQKIQPSVYGSNLVRHVDTSAAATNETQEKKGENKGIIAFPNVLNGLINKKPATEVERPKEILPKWKTTTKTVSKTAIMSRTRHIIYSIANAETEKSKLKRIDDLSDHIKMYPEAKNHAVKEGAVRLLIRIQEETQNFDIRSSIREAFALLGYCEPLPGRGIRILSIDGGGIRGLLVLEMLKKLEELTGKRIHELFDFMCGVSTGAIVAFSLGIHLRDLDTIAKHYKELSLKVFTQSTLRGTSNLVWSHAYYDTALWETLLKEYLGEAPLISTARILECPKLAAISAVVNHSKVSAYIFRNYSFPWRVQSNYMGGFHHKVWEAVRASAAAPTYFEEFRLGHLLHQDGGILVNNPTAVAIHEAKQLWPNTPIQCVVSFGTGRTIPVHPEALPEDDAKNSSWTNKFMKILDSATDTEGVHTMLNDLLSGDVYYRFNPYLTEMLSMVETDPHKIEQLEMDALMYLRRNEDKFQSAAKALTDPKPVAQKAVDWLSRKKNLIGFSTKYV
ncbi:calcium-independent phospholipase A2-gamma isoform X2 [Agrilus planipennis]|nr:calcium-independent phospholipase A2-gamma isoform X2 [Agrilus planipennis]